MGWGGSVGWLDGWVEGEDLFGEAEGNGGWLGLKRVAVGVVPGDVVVGITGDGPFVFVDEPMVKTAQGDEIVEVGWSSVGPVHDVVDLGPAGAATGWEPAALVTGPDQSSEPGRDGAGGSAYSDHAVGWVGYGELEAGVAGEAAEVTRLIESEGDTR